MYANILSYMSVYVFTQTDVCICIYICLYIYRPDPYMARAAPASPKRPCASPGEAPGGSAGAAASRLSTWRSRVVIKEAYMTCMVNDKWYIVSGIEDML